MKYDFDKIVDRRQAVTVKHDRCLDFFGREDITPLWVADMDFEVCPEISNALQKRFEHCVYGYSTPTDGFWKSIIDWQAKKNNFTFTTDDVIFVPGIVRGIAYAINFFTSPGDKIVIQEPVYHPFKNLTIGNKRTIVSNNLIESDGSYRMDLDNLEHIFATEKPKMMILCNPHNPIGLAWDSDTLAQVARLAKKHGVIVISDEIHSDLVLRGRKHCTFANSCPEAEEVSITFGAPSKTFNIAGIVSSWCVIKNKELRKEFFEWMECNEFSSPNFMACIATEAAYNHGEQWLDEAKHYIEDNIDFVADYCSKHIPAIKVIKPEASFLVWLDCRELGLDADALQDLFVNHALLGLNRGDTFGAAGAGYMRFNIATQRCVLQKALCQLADAVNKLVMPNTK
jgi:cystathionine beta-lyase